MKQSTIDHLKAQCISMGKIRRGHPREWQTYKLSNISTLSFIFFLNNHGNRSAAQLMDRLPLEVQKSPQALRICIAKLKQLERLKLIQLVGPKADSDDPEAEWEIATEGMAITAFSRTPVEKHSWYKPKEESHLQFLKYVTRLYSILLSETTQGYLFDTPDEAIKRFKELRWRRPYTTKCDAYMKMSRDIRNILESLTDDEAYTKDPLQLGMTVGQVTSSLQRLGHSI